MTLKDARRGKGWTQADLAGRAKVSQQKISRIESGLVRDPGHRVVMAICRALDADPMEIAEFQDGGKR